MSSVIRDINVLLSSAESDVLSFDVVLILITSLTNIVVIVVDIFELIVVSLFAVIARFETIIVESTSVVIVDVSVSKKRVQKIHYSFTKFQ
jgi:hypothetical protein